jgi:hypothetical protein
MSTLFNAKPQTKEPDGAPQKAPHKSKDNSPFAQVVAENKQLRSQLHAMAARIDALESRANGQDEWNAACQKAVRTVESALDSHAATGMHCPGCAAPNWNPGPQPCQGCGFIAPQYRQ